MVKDPAGYEVAALAPRLPPGGRVIEIGCGDGRVTRRYCDRVKAVVAIDPDAAAIAAFHATGLPANVEARAMPLAEFSAPHASTDVVLFSWSL